MKIPWAGPEESKHQNNPQLSSNTKAKDLSARSQRRSEEHYGQWSGWASSKILRATPEEMNITQDIG